MKKTAMLRRGSCLAALTCLFMAFAGCDGTSGNEAIPVSPPDLRGEDELFASAEFMEILDLQLRRDGAALAERLSDPSPDIRARAAFALASVQEEAARSHLAARLDDPEPAVRRDVVFALGQIPLEDTEPMLLELLSSESNPAVRGRIVEALGKRGTAESARALLDLTPDPDLEVIRATALVRRALHEVQEVEADLELIDDLLDDLVVMIEGEDADIRREAARFFARSPVYIRWGPRAGEVRAALDALAPDDAAAAGLLQGLVGLNQLEDHGRLLWWLANGADWRTRSVAAQGLGSPRLSELSGTRDALWDAVLDDPSNHVVAAASESLSAGLFASVEIVNRARRLLESDEVDWRRQKVFVGLLGEMGHGDEAVRWFERVVAEGPVATIEAIRALGEVPTAEGPDLIMALADHDDPGVRLAVVEAVSRRWQEWASSEARLQQMFDILALAVEEGEGPRANHGALSLAEPVFRSFGGVEVLREGWEARSGDSDDLLGTRQTLLRALGLSGDPDVEDVLLTAMDDPDFRIRRAAAAGLENLVGRSPEGLEVPAVERPVDQDLLLELGQRPRMILETNLGEIVLVLAADEAPHTVTTLAEYARERRFDNIRFHRVIPNFVAQGGDVVMGNGTGSPGARLRSEFTQIPFERGVVGMASSGKDTEGSQFFLTHAPQRHLDGAYTAFGWVESGEAVMDRLQIGDRIEGVRVEAGGR